MSNGTIYASGALYRNIDSGSSAPKGIVLQGDTQSIGTKPTRAFKDDIVYEAHVRGLTRSDSGIPAAYRGTYKGRRPESAVPGQPGSDRGSNFLPVQETQNDNQRCRSELQHGRQLLGLYDPELLRP
ncbi:hypothetical protein [Massilia eburnea]|uniref:hypothetical protein n=1 Tax=Massilia eburnea TaxID=1776165 RepID=UPI003D6C34A5